MPKQKLPSPSNPPDSAARLFPTPAHAPAVDYEIHQLQYHLQRIALIQAESPTLLSAAAILHSITLSLLSLTRLLHTHQVLQSAGEPVILHLEDALSDIASDLQECTDPSVASSMFDEYSDDPPVPGPLEEN